MNCALLLPLPDGRIIPELAATLRVLLARGLTLLRQRNYEGISSAVSRPWYAGPNAIGNSISNEIGYAKLFSPSQDAVIRVYDGTGNVIETLEYRGDFKGVVKSFLEAPGTIISQSFLHALPHTALCD